MFVQVTLQMIRPAEFIALTIEQRMQGREARRAGGRVKDVDF
jgi:hypothetical protein